jgi:O-antigen biosynthesis protein
MALFRLALELERRGHSCSIWLHDPLGSMGQRAAAIRREVVDHFAPLGGGLFDGFDDWHGADVAVATGWQTAHPVARLPDTKLRAYLVQDYEPDFYPASAERIWAEETYGMGFNCLASSPWLEAILRNRYGAIATAFDYGVDFDVYRPGHVVREPQTVLFYARPATPRRATELGLLALEQLRAARPDVRIVLFGDAKPPRAPFDYEFVGVREPAELAWFYSRATIGLVMSLTNYSLVPKEMMACGLPVMDVRGSSAESVFGAASGAIELVEPDPLAIAAGLEALLADPARRTRIADTAGHWVQGRTWGAAAETIESQLRAWLATRWEQSRAPRRSSAPRG